MAYILKKATFGRAKGSRVGEGETNRHNMTPSASEVAARKRALIDFHNTFGRDPIWDLTAVTFTYATLRVYCEIVEAPD